MGRSLQNDDLITRVYLLGAILDVTRERRNEAEAFQAMQTMVCDLQVRLNQTFFLTKEQKVLVKSFTSWSI